MVELDLPRFQPPEYRPHRLLRGGHLQTIFALVEPGETCLNPQQHIVSVSDGDSIVLHDDAPRRWQPADGSILMIHGLAGCHQASYMVRLAHRWMDAGLRVFRIDMRGIGAGVHLSRNISHSGRSDDVIAALRFIARQTGPGPIMALGVSLGGHQLLRAVSRIGAGLDPTPNWFPRLRRIAAVAPPLNIPECSRNMQRISRRPYNRYFIRELLSRIPPLVQQREEFQRGIAGRRPRTLLELDDRVTAPLSGFADAADYYHQSTIHQIVSHNPVPTLVLVADDAPIVPVTTFTDHQVDWPELTHVHVTHTGGHVGFIDQTNNCWMDLALMHWFCGRTDDTNYNPRPQVVIDR